MDPLVEPEDDEGFGRGMMEVKMDPLVEPEDDEGFGGRMTPPTFVIPD
jgi:hypothetical protein